MAHVRAPFCVSACARERMCVRARPHCYAQLSSHRGAACKAAASLRAASTHSCTKLSAVRDGGRRGT
eukprot:1007076-Pleurochrysis_carterae.AAC.1